MPNDKYEDEIRDILNRMDRFIPEGPKARPRPPRRPNPWDGWLADLRRRLAAYDSTSLIVMCIVLALAAAVLRGIYAPFGALAALASVACLLGAIVLPMLSGHFGLPERRWRGRVMDYEPIRMRRPFSWRYAWWRIKNFLGFR